MWLRFTIILLCVNYWIPAHTQTLRYSRKFDALKKNVPLCIINNHAGYFHVLRYNKLGHDLVVERRDKRLAEIVNITPLKLDSVNASWFDYENLDYLFFEQNHHVYFLFEKDLNNKKTVYLKAIDSVGHSSGFIELANLEKEEGTYWFGFEFRRVRRHILIVASRLQMNGLRKKVVLLFDPEKRSMVWIRKLPPENARREETGNFTCNTNHDLLYLCRKKRPVTDESEEDYLDSLIVFSWPYKEALPQKRWLNTDVVHELKNVVLETNHAGTHVFLQALNKPPDGRVNEVFINYLIDSSGVKRAYTFMEDQLSKKLTFYDGPNKQPYLKLHPVIKTVYTDSVSEIIMQRSEGYYSKEVIHLRIDMYAGKVISQTLIPHKVFFFKERTRFKSLGEVMFSLYQGKRRVFTIEHTSNMKQMPGDFRYNGYKKETNLWGANVVMYTVNETGLLKQLVYHNSDFDLVPLKYESDYTGDVIFYFNSSKYEKFGFFE